MEELGGEVQGDSSAVCDSTKVGIGAGKMGHRHGGPRRSEAPSLLPARVAALYDSCAGESWGAAHSPA